MKNLKDSIIKVIIFVSGVLIKSGIFRNFLNQNRPAGYLGRLFDVLLIGDFNRMVVHDLAWWPYHAQSLIDDHLKGIKHAKVFEWGAGSSTIWLAKRASHVTSIEHDKTWYEQVQYLLKSFEHRNVELRFVKIGDRSSSAPILSNKPGYSKFDWSDYCKEILLNEENYDLVVIDGRARVECFKNALKRVSSGGLIYVDNANRRRYSRILKPYKPVVVSGPTPGSFLNTTGYIFRK